MYTNIRRPSPVIHMHKMPTIVYKTNIRCTFTSSYTTGGQKKTHYVLSVNHIKADTANTCQHVVNKHSTAVIFLPQKYKYTSGYNRRRRFRRGTYTELVQATWRGNLRSNGCIPVRLAVSVLDRWRHPVQELEINISLTSTIQLYHGAHIFQFYCPNYGYLTFLFFYAA